MRGEIDVDSWCFCAEAGLPPPDLAERLLEDVVADLVDEAVRLGGRDERAGAEQSVLRMLPPHERLDSAHMLRTCLKDWLIVDDQFASLGGAAQVDFHLEPFDGDVVHLGSKYPVAALALALSRVHSEVCIAQ